MRIVAATGNRGKLAELSALLAPGGWEVVAQSQFNCSEAPETAVTFVENALLKARNACAHTGLAAIADDSGLEVDALHGEPGVRSARYAGAGASNADNIRKLLAALEAVEAPRRTARFRCVLVYMRHAADPAPVISAGVWEGRIAEAPAGDNGFGYDPVFLVDGLGKTAAQLNASVKNRLSHRARALRRLSAAL
ncbi:MAG: RdgB/HAM1 family non-canonical purine NTP pyrophosphatase [Gammaproteobacteria bacterium]|nr:RdgB/HAM1 family non-canonical purine NTP pyrophosphatase [Gammaproteobacteria bacterium]